MVSGEPETAYQITPTVLPLGDRGILVRFSTQLDDRANHEAIIFAHVLKEQAIAGIEEIVPNLASVLVRYDPSQIGYQRLAGELTLIVPSSGQDVTPVQHHTIKARFGGGLGPDLDQVAEMVGMSQEAFVRAHCNSALRVLATGFAPGFVYCGFHDQALEVPRRTAIRQQVPAGSILFAAGQTAITSTPIPTGWNVIGHTDLRNFDPDVFPPTRLSAGDAISFEPVL